MKKNTLATVLSTGMVSLGLTAPSEAGLLSRLDGKAVYDTDRNLTWLADANLAASNTFGVDPALIHADGTMSWYTAEWEWLPALNAAGHLGFSDWRLPASLQPDLACSVPFANILGSVAHYCTGSEMGHLFYEELGGTPGVSILDSGDPDLALFTNLANTGGRLGFWTSTSLPPDPLLTDPFAYYFFFDNNTLPGTQDAAGTQNAGPKYNENAWVAWAVRDGDVVEVAEPATLGLLGVGLAGLVLTRRRRTAAA